MIYINEIKIQIIKFENVYVTPCDNGAIYINEIKIKIIRFENVYVTMVSFQYP